MTGAVTTAERDQIVAIFRSAEPYHMKMRTLQKVAKTRGGRPLRNLPGKNRLSSFMMEETDIDGGASFLRDTQRKPGEIVNPVTGELVKGCLSLRKSAETLGITTQKLTRLMERAGLVHRVLSWKDVPMLTNPALRRPQYFKTPAAILSAIAAGFLIPIPSRRRGAIAEMVLVTPKGLAILESEFRKDTDARAPTKTEAKRRTVHRLIQQGRSQSEIVRRTAIPKQTVSRIVRQIKSAA